MERFYFLFLLLFLSFNGMSQEKNFQTDIQKILDGIIIENNYKPTDNHIFVVFFYYHPNDNRNYFTNIIYYDKNIQFGDVNNEEKIDKSWGIYNYKGFEIFFISRSSVDISQEIKFYKKTNDEGYHNEKGLSLEYDPVEYKFFVDKNFKYLPLMFLDDFPKDFVEARKAKIEKVLRHSYYNK